MFTPSQPGPREVYTGSITKFGLDIGATAGGEMVWAVYAPTTRRFGALAGHYGGAIGEATVGAGLGANVLVGGSEPHGGLAAGLGAGAGGPQRGGRRCRTRSAPGALSIDASSANLRPSREQGGRFFCAQPKVKASW